MINFISSYKKININKRGVLFKTFEKEGLNRKQVIQKQKMQKKKLSEKEIFRTIVFQYHLKDVVPLELLADVVSALYYPLDKTGQIRNKYKLILMSFMKEFNNQEKFFSEQQFCKFIKQLHKHNHDQYTKKICQRIFNRYKSEIQENIIDQQGFKRLSNSFKLQQQQIMKCFYNIANRKNQITFDRFLEYMMSLSLNQRK